MPSTETRRKRVSSTSTGVPPSQKRRLSEKDSQRFVNIHPAGDVVLCVGAEDDPLRLRVSSALLSNASPVFKAMLSNTWSEGQNLSATNPPYILLPEDDEVAMRRLLNLINGVTFEEIPTNDKLCDLLSVTILAHKYGVITDAPSTYKSVIEGLCDKAIKSLKHRKRSNTNALKSGTLMEKDSYFNLLVISWLVGCATTLSYAAEALIYCHPLNITFSTLADKAGAGFLPEKMFDVLEQWRIDKRLKLVYDLNEKYRQQKLRIASSGGIEMCGKMMRDPGNWTIVTVMEFGGEIQAFGEILENGTFDEYLFSWGFATEPLGSYISRLHENVEVYAKAIEKPDLVVYVGRILQKLFRTEPFVCLTCLRQGDDRAARCKGTLHPAVSSTGEASPGVASSDESSSDES